MAEKTEEKKDEGYKPEFEIVEQTDDNKSTDKGEDKKVSAGYEDDERLSAAQRDDDDDAADDASTDLDKGDETQEQIEQKRERRRRERKAQKARQAAARDRDAREMNFLRVRNEQLERAVGSIAQRVTNNEVAQVDGRLEQLKAARGEAEEVLARAIDAGNGSDVVKLQRTIRELEGGITRLTAYKAGLEKEQKVDKDEDDKGGEGDDGQQQQRRVQIPPSVAKNVEIFSKRHPWFKNEPDSEDARIVAALDDAVKAEGYDPATKDYWVELEDRMARRLPERMKALKPGKQTVDEEDDAEDDDPPPRRNGADKGGKPKGGPRMSSGSQTRGTGKQFLLSAERKQAMIEAGVWDDPELRDRYIRSYAEWDKANPAQAGR